MTRISRTLDSGCSGCPWAPSGKRGWVSGKGPDKADLVVVGEGPGDTETITGTPFSGRSGELFNATLEQNGLKRSDVYVTNSVMCNIKPSPADLSSCRDRLIEEIRSREPKIILALGKFAFNSLAKVRTPITGVVGTLWYLEDLGVWMIPTFHPAAALRSDGYFPDIANAIWRIAQILNGDLKLPDPAEKFSFPWKFFQTSKGIRSALRYYLHRADVAYRKGKRITISTDTESISPGKWPHPESDEWILWQFYDGKKAAALNWTVARNDPWSVALGKKLLRHPAVLWTMHNGAIYDTRVFRHNLGTCMRDESVRDTLVLGLGLSERFGAVGLEPLSRLHLNAPAYKKSLKDRGYRHAKGPQSPEQWRDLAKYGVEDTYFGYRLNRVLPPLVRNEGTMRLCTELLQPLALTCGRIAHRGMIVDDSQFEKLNAEWGAKCDELQNELQDIAEEAGWPFNPLVAKSKDGRLNPNSHPQLADLMYDTLGLTPTQGLTNRKFRASKWQGKERERSVDGDFLLGHIDEEACQVLQVYRAYYKLFRTYVLGLQREIELDGLIHPDFNIARTATGRLIVRPLLQVLPHYGAHRELADTNFASETRRLFPARPGYVIVAADFKQLELRVAAALSGDQALIKTLMSSDPHAVTARYMFQREQVDDADRHAAKRVTFGVAYNRSAFTLSRGPLFDVLGGDSKTDGQRQKLAQDFIDAFWDLYHVYRETQLGWVRTAFEVGELQTPFGRKRRWPLITHQNMKEVENQACNYPIQSTASDMCSASLVRLEPALAGIGYPQYTVHDQVVAEVREDCLQEALGIMHSVMTEPMFETNGTPFDVTFEVGPNLGDVEKVTLA